MLTKAILTGGVLSVLAGSIVYFGTEGADALERETRENTRVEDTELAGAPEITTESTAEIIDAAVKAPKKTSKKKKPEGEMAKAEAKTAETQSKLVEANAKAKGYVNGVVVSSDAQVDTPPAETAQEKPKTRWLDQYLKSDKKKAQNPESANVEPVIEKSKEVEIEIEEDIEVEETSGKKMMAKIEANAEPETSLEDDPKDKMRMKKKKIFIKMDGDKKMVWSSEDGNDFEIDGDINMDQTVDVEKLEKLLSEHGDLNLEDLKGSNAKIRILRRGDKHKEKGAHKSALKAIDYDAVLAEANKLQVIDMRNEAILEIVDYAIDRRDIGNAADIVDELSSPELRDTARARIGVGLATGGDMEAAFAVLDEIEIDELSAPIRLEIIAALMATRAERAALRPTR